MIGKYAWVPFIFGDIGYILGGWFSGYLMRRGWPLASARRLVLLVAAAMMPISIMAPFVSQAWMAIGLTCVITFGHALWISNLLTLPTDLFPGPRVGTPPAFPAWEARWAACSPTSPPATLSGPSPISPSSWWRG